MINFILNRYPTSNNVNEARMWKAKTNIRLANEEVAIEELTELMELELQYFIMDQMKLLNYLAYIIMQIFYLLEQDL